MLVHRIRRLLGVGVALLAGGLATALPAGAAPQRRQHRADHARHHPGHRVRHRRVSGGIAEQYRGDRDADNNGAPSDGDGNQ